jgi:hypothetical protein
MLRKMPGQQLVLETGTDDEVKAKLQAKIGSLVAAEAFFAVSGSAVLAMALRTLLNRDRDRL